MIKMIQNFIQVVKMTLENTVYLKVQRREDADKSKIK